MKPREKKENYSMIKIFFHMIKEILHVTPREFFLYTVFDIMHAGSVVLTVMLTQKFFDSVAKVASGFPLFETFFWLLCFLLGNVMMEICNGLSNFHTEYLSPKFLAQMHENLYRKAQNMDAIMYEDPNFLNQIEKAKQGIESGYLATLFVLSIFTFYIPYYLLMAWYLKGLSPFLVIIILFVFAPVIIGKFIRFKIFAQVEDDVAPMRRKMAYYEKAICDRKYFKETRFLGAYTYFIKLYHDVRDKTNRKIIHAEIRHTCIEFGLRVFTIGGYIGILAILIYEVIEGRISAGAFAAIFAGVGMMYNLAEEIFGGILQYISQNASAIQNYQKFMDIPEYHRKDTCDPISLNKGILLRNVYFKYPGADCDAIKGISLTIPQGKTVAIVGKNGSGKSTLMKLIMGLYQPTEGSVTVGGVETSQNRELVRKECSAVFQNFQCYRMTLGENVRVSDSLRSAEENCSIEEACKEAEVSLGENVLLDENIMLSKEFGGIDLSGGQWQRIAIARGLYRAHHMIVLDEPTAAIDPIEETRIYHQFAKITEGKTSFIVTHRVGAARIADFIIVMNRGKVEEIGTHQELIRSKGLYSVMYREQAKWYKRN